MPKLRKSQPHQVPSASTNNETPTKIERTATSGLTVILLPIELSSVAKQNPGGPQTMGPKYL